MRYIEKLSKEAEETLREMWRNHPQARARNRAHMLLLSNQGFRRPMIAKITQVHVNAVSRAFDGWEKEGVVGLLDDPKSGRPTKLTETERQRAIELVSETPQDPARAQAQLEKETGKKVHRRTFRRALRAVGLRWKRMRRSLKHKQDPQQVAQAREQLADFQQQEADGAIDLFYFDESGVDGRSAIPYGWQPVNQTLELPDRRGQRVNMLAFLNRANDCFAQTVVGRVDSQTVIACFDAFVTTLVRPAVIVLDNAKIHRSLAFKERQTVWAAHGLTLFFLPPYSPELNLIEILWRFIKYHWLPSSVFSRPTSLQSIIEDIFDDFGADQNYSISFG